MVRSPVSGILPNKLDAARGVLRRAGLRATAPRLRLLALLEGDRTHPTAADLYARLRRLDPTVSFATVYNTLAALERVGKLRPVDVGGARRFDPFVVAHDHAVCTRCGAVQDVPTRRRTRPAPLPGFEVERVETIYRGTCGRCQRARTSMHSRRKER
ncbi:MAG: transcriptional repressor [Myxococcota bacterium]|nr:transcriptional repressor [Myxococcota bacterium]